MVINTIQDKFYIFHEITERILAYALMYLRIANREQIDAFEINNYGIYYTGNSFKVYFYDIDKKVELPENIVCYDLIDYQDYLERVWKEKEENMRKVYKKYTGVEL
jgi:hypothetical protein